MEPQPSLTIWYNYNFPEPALTELREHVSCRGHRLVPSSSLQSSNLVTTGPDPLLADADIAFGQPDPEQVLTLLDRLRWVHLTTAGYTRYDRDDLRRACRGKRPPTIMTNSSRVYCEACAEHLLAMMLAVSRRIPQCMADQVGPQSWHDAEHRSECQVLLGQLVLVLGLGAIGSRLVELLQPFRMHITAIRRRPSPSKLCEVASIDKTDELLPLADHVVDTLPANAATVRFLNRRRIGLMKPSAILYNIGRGNTVDQAALLEALQNRTIAGAYLDVADPEPVPPGDPLWTAPNCFITPHTAGGHKGEFVRIVRHFVENLDRYTQGKELLDRFI